MNPQRSSSAEVTSLETDPCLVCRSLSNAICYESTFPGGVEEASNYFLAHRIATAHGTIVRCLDCGFVFTSPRFASSDYDQIYSTVRPPTNLDPSFETAKTARFSRLTSIIREFQPRDVPFLDFGCGDGGFLREFNSPSGRGFEIGPEDRRQAGSCEIFTGNWAKIAGSEILPPASVDFIVAFDVLEHLPRIEEDVELIRTVLKPRGFLFVSVPNIESFIAKAMGKHWNMLLLEHLWYFSPRTLERMMARHGFEMVTTRSLPFDASIAHIATRLAQSFGMKGTFGVGSVSRLVLPTPAGIMLGVFRKTL